MNDTNSNFGGAVVLISRPAAIGEMLILGSLNAMIVMKKKLSPPLTPPLENNEPKSMLGGILGGPPVVPTEEKPTIGSLIEQGQQLLKPLKELNEGHARGDRLVTSKEFYDLYKDGPSSKWCPDSPAAVDMKLKRLGMKPVAPGGKGRGKSKKWWELEAKKVLIKAKRKKEREKALENYR